MYLKNIERKLHEKQDPVLRQQNRMVRNYMKKKILKDLLIWLVLCYAYLHQDFVTIDTYTIVAFFFWACLFIAMPYRIFLSIANYFITKRYQ